MARKPKHIGFKAAEAKAKAGGARNPAAAIASAAQNASPEAKKRNPRLARVATKGSVKRGGRYVSR